MIKVPFNPTFFQYALIGLLGRTGNNHTITSNEGCYIYTYAPSNESEASLFGKSVPVIKEWLDMFSLTFSETRVAYEEEKDTNWYNRKVLIIEICYRLEKEQAFLVHFVNACTK